jgi:hypothetical protein
MTDYQLIMDKDDHLMTWGSIPNDLWMNILTHFVLVEADCIAFDGIQTREDISKITGFRDWSLQRSSNCELSIKFENQLKKEVLISYKLALFVYNHELHEKIASVGFQYWYVTSEDYPVDNLFFFRNRELLMIATAYESSIVFYGLSNEDLANLQACDKRISANLLEVPISETHLNYMNNSESTKS